MYKPCQKLIIKDIDKAGAFILKNRYFISCIKNNRAVEIATFEDGCNTLKLDLVAVISIKEQRTVCL